MAELNKNNAGHQKQVSSTFKGVPLPQSNSAQQPSGTPTPAVSPEPASVDKQTSQSSLLKKLNQSEDSQDKAEQNKSANVFPKSTFANKTPRSPLINKLPKPRELVNQPAPAVQPEDDPFFEGTGMGLWQQIKNKLFATEPGVNPIRQRAMVIMVPILAIIMIFAFRQVLSKAPRQTEGAGTDGAPVIVANADSGNEIDWKIPEPIAVITRDPINLPDESNTQNGEQNETAGNGITGTIIIRDIVFSTDKPSAVIGSKIVYVGDVINGITILKIDRDSIEFEKDGDRWEQNVRDGKKIPVLVVPDENEGQSEPIKE